MLTLGSLAIWKARKAVVNNCSNVLDRGTVIARNIRLRSEQLPSNTFIVSAKVRKKSASQYLSIVICNFQQFAFLPSSRSSLSFSFFSLSLSHLCADSFRPAALPSLLPNSSSRNRPASPLLKSSDMLRAMKSINTVLIRMLIAHLKDYSDPKKSC